MVLLAIGFAEPMHETISQIEVEILRFLASRPQGYNRDQVVNICITRLDVSRDVAEAAFNTLDTMELITYKPHYSCLDPRLYDWFPTDIGRKHLEDFS